MRARRLLVITYNHPPDRTGGHRWALMGAWLRTLGHRVTTITTSAYGTLPDDLETDTQRVANLAASPALRRVLRRPPLRVGATVEPVVAKPPSRLLRDVVVPDAELISWALGVVPVARRLVRERAIDCLVTTGPPHSTHLVGLALGRASPAWIADFRDGWRYEPLRPGWPTRIQDRLDAALERRVVRGADAVIGVTRPIADDLRSRLGVAAVHIGNGWDPRWETGVAEVEIPQLEPDTVSVVHTGTLGGGAWRDPAPLFAALRRLRSSRSVATERLRLVLAGVLDPRLQTLIESVDAGIVRHVGELSREQALALQRRGDALLLLTSPGHASHATGKLFEYLAAGRPIIALAQGNEAARIVRETATSIAVAPDDVDGIARALTAAVDGTIAGAYSPRGLEQYMYPRPAEAVAGLIEHAIARRAGAAGASEGAQR
jgi:glycosyltransferase involved in cell wall biosynthesis